MLLSQLTRGLFPLFLAIVMLVFARPAGSQQPISAQDQQPISTLKVNVNVVNVYCNVKDKHGALVADLHKDDFQLFEDGNPQPIKYFSAETDQPLTLGLLIDTSPSQQRVLPMEQQVGGAFLDEVLRSKDLAFLIGFDANVDLLEDYTSSARELRQAMDRVHIGGGGPAGGAPGIGQGPFPTSNRACCTALYDAIYLAAGEKLSHEVGRKAMILLTDGEDEGSKMKIRDAVEAAQKADAICYVILIADRGFYGGMGYSGDSAMRQLTEDTGGRVIQVGNKPDKLKAAFDQIANELRSQYGIGYTPTNLKKDGSFRKIELRNKEGYKVQARRGYYAIQQE
jgi:VWFA-related protein